MGNKTYAPIVLFVYNRPEHTKKTVDGILTNPEAKDTILYIFADGPKLTASEDEKAKINAVREYIHTIKGFKDVIIEESEINRGLAPATIYGVTKIFNYHDRVIMLEDDDIPTSHFLAFENECLEKYKDDSKIWCVGGYVFYPKLVKSEIDDDIYLVNKPTSWGFGTWKRCWDKVIWDMETLKGLFAHKSIVRGFSKWCGSDMPVVMFSWFEGRASSWSIRYNFAAYLNDSKTIRPKKSLIWNCGMDGTGTHNQIIKRDDDVMEDRITIPEVLKFDRRRNSALLSVYLPQNPILRFLMKKGYYEIVSRIAKIRHKR